MPKVPSLPHRPRQSIDSQAVDMWTTLKKRSPHAHSHNKCKCQARSDIDQEAAVRFTSIRHITHIRRAQPTDSPEEAFSLAPGAHFALWLISVAWGTGGRTTLGNVRGRRDVATQDAPGLSLPSGSWGS